MDYNILHARSDANFRKFQANWQAIIDKYSQYACEDDDEICLRNLSIARDNGRLRSKSFVRKVIGKSKLAIERLDYLPGPNSLNNDLAIGTSNSSDDLNLSLDVKSKRCGADINATFDLHTTFLVEGRDAEEEEKEPSDAETISSDSSWSSEDEFEMERQPITKARRITPHWCGKGASDELQADSAVERCSRPAELNETFTTGPVGQICSKFIELTALDNCRSSKTTKDPVYIVDSNKPTIDEGSEVGLNMSCRKPNSSVELYPTENGQIVLVQSLPDSFLAPTASSPVCRILPKSADVTVSCGDCRTNGRAELNRQQPVNRENSVLLTECFEPFEHRQPVHRQRDSKTLEDTNTEQRWATVDVRNNPGRPLVHSFSREKKGNAHEVNSQRSRIGRAQFYKTSGTKRKWHDLSSSSSESENHLDCTLTAERQREKGIFQCERSPSPDEGCQFRASIAKSSDSNAGSSVCGICPCTKVFCFSCMA